MPRPTTGLAYLTLIVVVLGGLVFITFVTVPAWSTWRGEQDRLSVHREKLAEKEAFLRDIDRRAAELTQFDADVRALRVMFPEMLAPADLSAVLHAIATQNGVTIDLVSEPKPLKQTAAAPEAGTESGAAASPGGAQASPTPTPAAGATRASGGAAGKTYEFTVGASGSYAQVRAFALDLERSVRYFDIAGLSFDAKKIEGTSENTVIGRVTLWAALVNTAK